MIDIVRTPMCERRLPEPSTLLVTSPVALATLAFSAWVLTRKG
jgi:hypothetical protein